MTRTNHLRTRHGRALAGLLLIATGLGSASMLFGAPQPAAADTPPATTGPACPASNPPNTLALVGGTPQIARLGTAFADPFQVVLANTNGCPVTTGLAGAVVTFTAPASGATGTFAASGSNISTVGTNAAGMASASLFTAGDTPGNYSIVAASSYGSVSFSLANTAAGVPLTISASSPAAQTATAGSRYGQPLQVTVLDANGNPVRGASVTFALGSGGTSGAVIAGASFDGGGAQAVALTDASGVATSPRFTANDVAGGFRATASTAGIAEPASFSLDNLAKRPATITTVGRARLAATIATRYRHPLQVKVRDGNGVPLRGATVTFTLGAASSSAAAAGAGASFVGGATQATATTDSSGLAVSPRFMANSAAGAFAATASVAAAARPVSFSLRNLAGAPATVASGVASSQSATVGDLFPVRLAVTVTDAHANPVPGAMVIFSAPNRGPSGRFASRSRRVRSRTVTVKTDRSGIAVAPAFTANARAGGYVVKAIVRGARQQAAFALVNQRSGSGP
jgi:protocatechuate 3,4-dioxygenase beta subunit